jgi:hypothetical protein
LSHGGGGGGGLLLIFIVIDVAGIDKEKRRYLEREIAYIRE